MTPKAKEKEKASLSECQDLLSVETATTVEKPDIWRGVGPNGNVNNKAANPVEWSCASHETQGSAIFLLEHHHS